MDKRLLYWKNYERNLLRLHKNIPILLLVCDGFCEKSMMSQNMSMTH